MTIKYIESEFINACKTSISMAEAAARLGLHFNTFKRHALILGVYNTNQSGKGILKPKPENGVNHFKLQDILDGKHPQYQSFKLRNRLIAAGVKNSICESCGINEWNDKSITIELDHIDGNSRNHKLINLRMLCPNCHSQTETYRAKNRILNRTCECGETGKRNGLKTHRP